MMKSFGIQCAVLFAFACGAGYVSAQELPKPSPEHKVLTKDVGQWDAKIKMWGPGSDDPETTEGVDSTRMVGEMWTITEFKGKFFGQDFSGHGTFGYDPAKKKFVGTWVDSMTPHMMLMEGTYDEKANVMTLMTTTTDPETGKPQKGKNVTKYDGKDRRVMTMYMELEGMDEMFKTLEITYTRKK